MKIGIWIAVDDLDELRSAVIDRCEDYAVKERVSAGYPGEREWRAKREACQRILDALPPSPGTQKHPGT